MPSITTYGYMSYTTITLMKSTPSVLDRFTFWPLAKALRLLLYPLLRHILRYRRRVIIDNLERSKLHKKITSDFYKHLVDLLASIPWLAFGSLRGIQDVIWLSPEEKNMIKEDQSYMIWTAHYGNWEHVAIGIPSRVTHQIKYVYQPQSGLVDRILAHIRTRGGAELIPQIDLLKTIYRDRLNEQPTIYVLLIDQGPVYVEKAFWVRFLGRVTPFLSGPERIARKCQLPVFYTVPKKKEGYIEISLSPINTSVDKGEMTRQYARFLEQDIYDKPQLWLWSHKRWKRAHRIEDRLDDSYLLLDK